jgi:hypothetical protein
MRPIQSSQIPIKGALQGIVTYFGLEWYPIPCHVHLRLSSTAGRRIRADLLVSIYPE